MLTKILVTSALLLGTASAQCTLTSSGGAAGTTLQFSLDGTDANAIALLVVGATQGTTSIPIGPLATLDLGLVAPFYPAPLGMTDANGDASVSFPVPSTATMGIDLFAQGVTLAFSFTPPTFGLTTCSSNVLAFTLGG